MISIESEIEQDLAWREAEMGTLKLILASSISHETRRKALLRACCAMLYAHYEGFCKFCWSLLLNNIQREAAFRRDLIEPVAIRSMISIFRGLRGQHSDEALWRFSHSEFAGHLGEVATFPDEIDTESNLWPRLFREINESLGLNCHEIDTHQNMIGQLVGRRNEIAHGEKLEIDSISDFQQFEHAAVIVMYELAIAVEECLRNKSYLRSYQDPATLI